MHETISKHVECTRTRTSQIWSTTRRQFRPLLNVALLTKILSTLVAPDQENTSVSGKRKATDFIQLQHRSKRARTSQGSEDEADSDAGESDSSEIPSKSLEGYPPVRLAENCTRDCDVLSPILRHVAEIQYTNQNAESNRDQDVQTLKTWDDEDRSLSGVLYNLSISKLSKKVIDLGEIRIGDYDGRIVAFPVGAKFHLPDTEWLFLLPMLMIDGPSHDFSELASNDLFSACRILQDAGKISLDARLKIILSTDSGSSDSVRLPFCFQFELIVSLAVPRALEYTMHKRALKRDIIAHEDAQRRLLRVAFGDDSIMSDEVDESITVATFYNVMGPAPALPSDEARRSMQPDELLPTLLPFQCSSVAWLLEKEGMSVLPNGTVVPRSSPAPFCFWKEVQVGNHTLYFNILSGDLIDEQPDWPVIHGGMLAEEPGLGKTLETIALILLNPAPPSWNPSLVTWDDIACSNVKAVKSSLIITPPSLISQWTDELKNNAPSLKVLVYDGWSKWKGSLDKASKKKKKSKAKTQTKLKTKNAKGKGKGKRMAYHYDSDSSDDWESGSESASPNISDKVVDWAQYAHQYDVVITTYSVLRSEIWVARPAPDRPKRDDAMYDPSGRTRSPLVLVKWKRVVMDEVQMVGGGQAAEMTSYIPRLSSIAVSGTPAKAQMSDLIHVLKFLRIDQFVGNLRLWNRLLKPGFVKEFSAFIQHYGIRTAKASLTSELTIPKQTRYLVGIELGKVERHVYDQTLEKILFELGLDTRGVAATDGWRVDGNILRTAIRRLRGICTHPQVGQIQRKGDGLFKAGALKSMEAVLETMTDQNWRSMMDDWKTKIQTVVKSAQLLQHDEQDKNRYQRARDRLKEAETDVRKLMNELQDVLAAHDVKGKALKSEEDNLQVESDPTAKGKGRMITEADESKNDDDDDDDEEELGLPKTPAGDEHRIKRRAIKQRLRENSLLLHKINFLQGDVFHVLGKSAEEDAAYQAAEELRRQLLKGPEAEAKLATYTLSANATRKNLTLPEILIDLPLLGQGGIRSALLMEEANTLIEEVFNEQAELLWKWRQHILELLSKPLAAHDGEAADGQEYQRTLDEQGEADTYLHAYAALLADRRQALTSERTLLAEHEVREKKARKTKAAMKASALYEDDGEEFEEEELRPEQEVLLSELSTQRKDILVRLNGRAIKSILVELGAVNYRITPETHPEKIIVKDAIATIRQFMNEQSTLFDKLEGDIALIRKAFNQRVLYFRQLQEISDSVVDVEWDQASVEVALQDCLTERNELELKINTTRARQRYLENLSRVKEDDESEDDQTCILCRCDFIRGFITHCAHVFCEACMKAWLSKDNNKTCPVCRVAIDLEGIQRFRMDTPKDDIEQPKQIVSDEPVPKSRREIVYNRISPSLFSEIKDIETFGDYGSKVQTLVRHLCYLKHSEPGAKSIIFSAWADSLQIVEVALKENGIKCLRLDQGSKKGSSAIQKFRKDPENLVLLLDGERQNAGLNITCASRVFLLESVVHHSFEVQAIARIDRLGQTRPTEVYCYYAEDTVERNILDLAARKGLSLYTQGNSIGTISVSPFANESDQIVDNPAKRKAQQKGDFIHKVDDMLAILFPHMYEDLEYLLPPTEEPGIGQSSSVDIEMVDGTRSFTKRGGIDLNAEAGPSRRRY